MALVNEIPNLGWDFGRAESGLIAEFVGSVRRVRRRSVEKQVCLKRELIFCLMNDWVMGLESRLDVRGGRRRIKNKLVSQPGPGA